MEKIPSGKLSENLAFHSWKRDDQLWVLRTNICLTSLCSWYNTHI